MDLTDERDALAAVFAEPDAFERLSADGWFEALPDAPGSWDTIGVATAAAELAGATVAARTIGAQYAAAATLADAGEDATGPLALAVDARDVDGVLRARWWGTAHAERLVVQLPDGSLATASASATTTSTSPLLWLRRAAVHDVELRDVSPLGDVALGSVHTARAAHFLAAEAVGAAEAATSRTLAFVREREQFGSPIGSQQVVQHRLVDMHLRALSARAALDRSTEAWTTGDGSSWAWRAKLLAGTHGVWTIENAIQLHGGIGFTEELGLGDALWVAQRARLLLASDATAVVADLPRRPPDAPRDWAREYAPVEE